MYIARTILRHGALCTSPTLDGTFPDEKILAMAVLMRTHLAATLLLRGAAACGGDLDPGSGDAVGTGTGTLVVEGSARASPHQIDARTPVDFDTEFSVRVSLNQLTVTTGTVTITSATGKTTLTFVDDRWRESAPGHDVGVRQARRVHFT